jgi:hypothetical protein
LHLPCTLCRGLDFGARPHDGIIPSPDYSYRPD